MSSKKKERKAERAAVSVDTVETRDWSIGDPAFAQWLSMTSVNGTAITESSAFGITGFYRAVSLISGTVAGLPLKSYQKLDNDARERVPTVFDRPQGPFQISTFTWTEMVMLHLLIRGEAFLQRIRNEAGQTVGYWPIHPAAVTEVKWTGFTKAFKVSLEGGKVAEKTSDDIVHVMALTTDGVRGISPLTVFRKTIQLSIDAETAAARVMSNGMSIAGLVTPDGDMTADEATAIKAGLNAKLSGPANAGDIAVVNRALKFSPWSMSLDDAQFMQSREFQVIEFCRMYGIPPHLAGAVEKVSSWGTGIAEMNLGLQKYTLTPWTSRLEDAFSDELPDDQYTGFDYRGLLQGTPKDEIELLIKQVDAGLLTKDEARALMDRGPLPPAQPEAAPQKEAA